MSIYLSAPAIARLSACSRIAAHLQMRNGRYGPLLQRGRVPYADARRGRAQHWPPIHA